MSKRLGYYAMDKNNNLFQFEWGTKDDKVYNLSMEGGMTEHDAFFIIDINGKRLANPKNYEILEIGFFTADDY
jgi:hypothetical protein